MSGTIRFYYQSLDIGTTRITLKLLSDLNQFSDPTGTESEGPAEDTDYPLFGIVWASSEVLSHLMLDIDCRGKRVLEIGCGMALVSHFLNARGVDISAMDIHPFAGELLRENIRLNATKQFPFINASWSEKVSGLGEFDFILGSDILYESENIEALSDFIHHHANQQSEVVIVDPDRGLIKNFQQAMTAHGFTWISHKPGFTDHLGIPYTGTVHRFSRTTKK